MGCDIHFYIEKRNYLGDWQAIRAPRKHDGFPMHIQRLGTWTKNCSMTRY